MVKLTLENVKSRLAAFAGSIYFAVRLFLKNIDSYSSYIESSPDNVRDSFVNGAGICNFCKEKCAFRKTYNIFGQEYNKYGGCTFEFYDLDPICIPYYAELIKSLARSRKK
jgi:hypothetical protein